MIRNKGRKLRWTLLVSGLLAACLLPSARTRAQAEEGSYRSGEGNRPVPDTTGDSLGKNDHSAFMPAGNAPIEFSPSTDEQNAGPVRLARFAVVSGNVSWRTDNQGEWSMATVNLPIREAAQIWVTNGGHADLQFDDGSELRLGNGSLATLKTLFSDRQGEFTQISLSDGMATLCSRHDDAVYQVDTPAASVKSRGASQIRFGVDSGVEISVQHGDAIIDGRQGKIDLQAGDYVYVADSNSPYNVRRAPRQDSWDRWNEDRNRTIEDRGDSHVPSNIGLVSGELNDYGTWRDDPANGWVWCPRSHASDWRPYHDGHWTWVDPFGWTWVADEPWGWAPYHYGTWVHESYGWGWCPGPVHQYWSPAVVSFSVYDGCAAWAPLCPSEVRYPSESSFSYWGRDWAFSFSIGSAGCYYPQDGYCTGRSFNSYYVNHFNRFRDGDRFSDRSVGRGFRSPSLDRFARADEFAATNRHFVPFNAVHASGGSLARLDAFGGTGRYQALGRGDTSYFARGRHAAAPAAGTTPVGGPPSVMPTNMGRTPTRTFATGARPSQSALNRPLFHAPMPITTRREQSPSIGASGGRTNDSNSSPMIGSRARASSMSSRSGIGEGRIPQQPTRPTDVFRGSAHFDSRTSNYSSRQPAFEGSRIRSNDTRLRTADAARQARSSLGYGGRTPGDLEGASRSGGSGSGAGRTPGSSVDGSYTSRRAPSGGSYGRANDYGSASVPSGRAPSSGSYGRANDYGSKPASPSGGSYSRANDYGSSSVPSRRAPNSGSYGGANNYGPRPALPSGGGDSYGSGRSRSYGSGDYNSGRSSRPSADSAPRRSGGNEIGGGGRSGVYRGAESNASSTQAGSGGRTGRDARNRSGDGGYTSGRGRSGG